MLPLLELSFVEPHLGDMKTSIALSSVLFASACVATAGAQSPASISAKIAEINKRPEFIHAGFGVAAYDLDTKQLVYGLNEQQLFTPGSTTKLLTAGTALALLGADHRFRTPVYRTGPVTNGVLKGDIVLVGTGDPNLSGRILGDTLGFGDEDHSYAGRGDSTSKVIGDPLFVMRRLAGQIADRGIKRIEGRVLADVSLLPQGERELGTGMPISSLSTNDNVVDLLISPGAKPGDRAVIRVSPDVGAVRVVNELVTGAPHSGTTIRRLMSRDSTGVATARLSGSYAADGAPSVMGVGVWDPAEFASIALTTALKERGITIDGARAAAPDVTRLAATYGDSTRIAEHVSPPLSEMIKVMLKVSQNLHASMMPYVIGATIGRTPGRGSLAAGLELERSFLERAGLDLAAASQGDGAGGAQAAFYSPAFMVQYLAYMASRPDSAVFRRALPILGRDGTLWNIQSQSPAAGRVIGKTGTFTLTDPLNRRPIVLGKGLAGYMTTSSGRRLAFAIYANRIPFPPGTQGNDAALLVGQAVGEIAAAIWGAPIP